MAKAQHDSLSNQDFLMKKITIWYKASSRKVVVGKKGEYNKSTYPCQQLLGHSRILSVIIPVSG